MLTIEDLREAKYVLPEDAVLSPVDALPKSLRKLLEHVPTDYAYTRRYARAGTKILSQAAGLLLEEFRAPTTLLDAVVRFSKSVKQEPVQMLDAAGVMLLDLVGQSCLTREGSLEAEKTKPTFAAGDKFEDLEILRCCQLLQDTEVFQAKDEEGRFLALKIVRNGQVTPYMTAMFEREGQVLEHLGGHVSPKLFRQGQFEERPYLVMEWLEGFPLSEIIVLYQKRTAGASDNRVAAQLMRERLELAIKVTKAYADIHERGVAHGDVHSNNIFLMPDSSIRIIDFGFGRMLGDEWPVPPRAGVCGYYEPEYAEACRNRTVPPPASPEGEQYAAAVLAYELLTNEFAAKGQYLPLSAEQPELLRQIVEDTPLPLTSYFVTHDQEVEGAILRALEKDPAKRHASLSDLGASLESAAKRMDEEMARQMATPSRGVARDLAMARELTASFMRWSEPDGIWFKHAFEHSPACSVNYGAAGVAYGLYRLASLREDADLLARADLWNTKGIAHANNPKAFFSREIEINEESVGPVSPYHTASGLYLVQAYIDEARASFWTCQQSLNRFVEMAEVKPCDNLDLTLGKTAVLVGCANAMDHFSQTPFIDLTRVRELGNRTDAAIWRELNTYRAIADGTPVDYTGIAHGWAGLCYGALRWHAACGTSPSDAVRSRLDELVEMAERDRNGARWPFIFNGEAHSSGWCNGHAGWVFLWTEAARTFGDPRYASLAEAAGVSTWQERAGIASLCCGAAGKSYALMDLYRFTGDTKWLRRAEKLAGLALQITDSGYSLYKSMTGVVLAAADIERPEGASMALFERETPLLR